jgi:hypothetical protein
MGLNNYTFASTVRPIRPDIRQHCIEHNSPFTDFLFALKYLGGSYHFDFN